MRTALRCMVSVLLLHFATPAAAQYLRMTTDNPAGNTKLRSTGTTIVTITLDTNHDRSGALQTCNSHTSANCGAPSTAQPLDMFSYTVALKAVGGTVTWGAFSAADAAYTDTSPQIQNSTEVEINKSRPTGTFSSPGVNVLGTIPVTPASGAPGIQVQIGAGTLNPYGFGTGFGTSCDAFFFGNTYVIGDPADPCGNTNGIAGDWFDWDGVTTNRAPTLNQPSNMTVNVGSGCGPATADQVISGSDPDGDPLTFAKVSGPSYMTVTTTTATTGNIHLAPSGSDVGGNATVSASDGTLSNQKSFTIFIGIVNQGPVLAQPANMTVNEGATANQTLTATAPCPVPLTFSKVSGPSFVTVTTTNPGTGTATGNLHLAPSVGDQGTYSVTVAASDGSLNTQKNLTVTVSPTTDQAPTLNPIANMGTCSVFRDQTITGSDPDGDPLTFSKAAGPTFMTVTTLSPTQGNIHLAPGAAEPTGTYAATARASDGTLSADRSFTITITGSGCPPVLDPINNMFVAEGAIQDQTITGHDPNGDPLVFTKDSGPTFMTVTTTNSGTGTATGNIHLAPGFTDAGTYSAAVLASDGSLASSRSFTISVCNSCGRAPVVNPIADMTVVEGNTADQTVTGSDPDGDPLTFFKSSGPIFMTVSTLTTTSGNVHLAPGLADAGTYNAVVSASDGSLTASRGFSIIALTSGNRCPTANTASPHYSGIVGIPLGFNGTLSSDPDGNPLSYAWDFDASNGITVDATGALASHVYPLAGSYTVTLTVTDNGDGDPAQICSNSATTTADITSTCAATVFNGYDTIRLGSGKPFWFGYVQPSFVGCFTSTDVVISSFVMKYAGRQISASGKTDVGGDKNGDGIAEVKVSFSKDDLRVLFSGTGLANGHNTVTVTLEASLTTGGKASGTTQLDVVNNGNFTVATVSPNPLNPEATLTYTTTRQGAVRIDLFDIQGRLVRRIVDESAMAAGTHEAIIDGRGSHGEKLPSGVYYIRGTSSEGEFKQLITILK